MEDASPPQTPSATRSEPQQRSRSRSIISNAAGAPPLVATPTSVTQYSPESHPTTDPSLLALTQQQVADSTTVPVDIALLDQSQLASAANAFPIDPALEGPAPPEHPIPTNISPDAPSISPPIIEMARFQDAHTLEEEEAAEEAPAGEDEPATRPSGGRNKRGSSAGEDNDAELRRLAAENADVELEELARRVRNDENSPSAEKTRQVYGLGWLMHNCERVPDTSVAVPRNRVYARYVTVCANEKIKPLNPASFGKLVRLLYPEIKTRRLGVRGQSKYHYCGIRLAGEHSSPNASHGPGSASGSEPPAHAVGEDHVTSNRATAPVGTFVSSNPPSKKPRHESPLSKFMLNGLCFMRQDPEIVQDVFRIPDINPYIPPGTDLDVAATLTAIYRSHCTSLVECVRYMRLKQFHQLFVSFHGTLTVPVQKLLAVPSLAPWIREADWVMYKEMIRLLSPLALQVVPSFVLTALRQLSTNLATHISVTFSACSEHIIQAKLVPATIFASLLDRLLRVNDAAHAAARFLGNPPDREQMIKDWQAYVNAQMIVDREIPCHAPLVKNILESEIPNLLQPGCRERSPAPGIEDGASTESVLDKWTNFLTSLPDRFGVNSPRYFNICLGAVSSASLRDLTTNGAISFGSWWVVRCWIDEWMSWQAERGGFLSHGAVRRNGDRRSEISDIMDTSEDLAHDDSGISLKDDNINLLEDVGDDRDNRMVVPVNFGK